MYAILQANPLEVEESVLLLDGSSQNISMKYYLLLKNT